VGSSIVRGCCRVNDLVEGLGGSGERAPGPPFRADRLYGSPASPKLTMSPFPLFQCGMKSTLCLLNQFEEQQLLGWGQTWASPPARSGTINHQ
jgi:hypothetical protein